MKSLVFRERERGDEKLRIKRRRIKRRSGSQGCRKEELLGTKGRKCPDRLWKLERSRGGGGWGEWGG